MYYFRLFVSAPKLLKCLRNLAMGSCHKQELIEAFQVIDYIDGK